MDLKTIKRLIELVEKAKISHFSIEQDGIKIEIKKEGSNSHASSPTALIPPVPLITPPQKDLVIEEQKSEPLPSRKNSKVIKSQMVGTFYEAPNPNAKPYVKVGDYVKTGQVICIIEAMKLMNEIKSEISGVVTEILVENGDPVEFGTVLFLIEPA